MSSQVRADRKQERADRDHVKDAAEVVRRRVIGPLLVPFVQPVELRDDDPGGQRQEEQRVFSRPRNVVRTCDRGVVTRSATKERCREPDEIGEKQHPPHEPAPPLARRLSADADRGSRASDRRLSPSSRRRARRPFSNAARSVVAFMTRSSARKGTRRGRSGSFRRLLRLSLPSHRCAAP